MPRHYHDHASSRDFVWLTADGFAPVIFADGYPPSVLHTATRPDRLLENKHFVP
jgi:hypothetical protein